MAGDYSGFDELAFNIGAALDNGEPIGDGHPALKDKRVRQAIAHAIDKQTLVDRVLRRLRHARPPAIIPPSTRTCTTSRPTARPTTSTWPRPTGCSTRPATRTPTATRSGRCPTAAGRCSFRLFARQESKTSQQSVQFIAGLAASDIGIATEVKVLSENRLTEIIGQGEFDMFEWGWVVEPDPDYQLSTFTCGSRSYKTAATSCANLSDSFYCNPEYDKLYEQQKVTIDPAERAEIVKQMQQMLYDDAPYVVTFYYDDLAGLPQRPLHRLHGRSPTPDGVAAVPVRHLQLPQHRHRRRRPPPRSDDGGGPADRADRRRGGRGRGGRGAAGPAAEIDPGRARVAAAGPMAAISTRTCPAQRRSAPARPPSCSGRSLSLAFVLVFNFFLFRVLPGDPAKNLTRNRLVPAEQVQVLRESFGLGKPLHEQFVDLREGHRSAATWASPTSSAGRCRR